MKLAIDPMPLLREAKKVAVNANFAKTAQMDLHRDLAHAQKLQWAVSGNFEALQPEANLRGITTDELQKMILSKASNALADRELARQQIMARIEAAKTPDDLDAI